MLYNITFFYKDTKNLVYFFVVFFDVLVVFVVGHSVLVRLLGFRYGLCKCSLFCGEFTPNNSDILTEQSHAQSAMKREVLNSEPINGILL